VNDKPTTEGIEMDENTPIATLEGLAILRRPFPAHQIGKLPKPTRAQTDAVKADFKAGVRCSECHGWHHPQVVHLDYVGHAALTDRLLDADPMWYWEPLAYTEEGLPRLDKEGGLWGKLTVCGVTRLGYGNADAKSGADAGARLKEVIGDFLRNSSMRFGAALDLWHKGDLHQGDEQAPARKDPAPVAEPEAQAHKHHPQPADAPASQEPASRTDTGGATITSPQLRILLKALERKGLAEHTLTDAFGIAALDQLPAASINDAIEWVSSQGSAA
jgi:hypothetical protein